MYDFVFTQFFLQSLKQQFERLALYAPPTTKEEHVQLLKNLQKAMLKSDDKKGLFAKLQNSRSEAVYKLLAKGATPLALASSSSDYTFVRDYLLQYSLAVQNTRKRRSKVCFF